MAQADEVHFVGQVAQKALIENDGKILLVQYPFGDGDAAGKWDMPGGRLNVGETAMEGLKREVFEEIGAEIEVKEILATGLNKVTDTFSLFFIIYKATLLHPAQALTLQTEEIGKAEWRPIEDFFTLPIVSSAYQETLEIFFKSGKKV